MSQGSFAGLLEIDLLEQSGTTVRLSATVGSQHLNLHGSAHGGFLYSLADEAFALACNAPPDARAVALNTTLHHFRAVQQGETVEARATELHRGRSTGTYQVELWVGERRVALFTGTAFRIAREVPSGSREAG